MSVLTADEQALASGARGDGAAMAMRIVAEAARLMGAPRLIPIASAHIDGALYHGDSGTLFAEKLVEGGARVAVHSSLNVGALDLVGCCAVKLDPHRRDMAKRMMRAYEAMGCAATWTCAPYQAGHRPATGTDVAWGKSNAVVFCNSVLGARTNRYGDFLDIACASRPAPPIMACTGRRTAARAVVFDVGALPAAFARLGHALARSSAACMAATLGYGHRRRLTGVPRHPRRGCAEGARRGRRLVRRGRPVPCRRRDAGSARPRRPRCGGAEGRRKPSASW